MLVIVSRLHKYACHLGYTSMLVIVSRLHKYACHSFQATQVCLS